MKNLSMLLLALAVLCGCNGEKQAAKRHTKQISKARYTFADFPGEFSLDCAVHFPVIVSDATTTSFHAAKQVDWTVLNVADYADQIAKDASADTRAILLDSFKRHPLYIRVKLPPGIPDTFMKETKITVENTAKVSYLSDVVAKLTADTAARSQHIIDDSSTIHKQKKWITGLSIAEAATAFLLLFIIFKRKK